ncbi:hypothetical protein LDK12_11270 [Fusobacterium pseudoperiodonticum]|jgi:hypothetical protein|uniref:hypothetical protein n=1 Tax=Fusobacterium pseudoperiodonticum TaxID=2663009 RepID=UPI0030D5F5F4
MLRVEIIRKKDELVQLLNSFKNAENIYILDEDEDGTFYFKFTNYYYEKNNLTSNSVIVIDENNTTILVRLNLNIPETKKERICILLNEFNNEVVFKYVLNPRINRIEAICNVYNFREVSAMLLWQITCSLVKSFEENNRLERILRGL